MECTWSAMTFARAGPKKRCHGGGVVGAQGSRWRFDNQRAPARITTLACSRWARRRRPGPNRGPALSRSSWCTLRELGEAGVSRRMRKDWTVGQQHRELEAARVAIVSLLAVTTDEQLRSVKTALEALEPMYDAARAELEDMRIAFRRRRPAGGQDQDIRQAIEAHLAMLDKAR